MNLLLCGVYFDVYRFYTEGFGMKLLRKRDIPEEKYSNAFLGFGPEESQFVVELTYSMFKPCCVHASTYFEDLLGFCCSVTHNYSLFLLLYRFDDSLYY